MRTQKQGTFKKQGRGVNNTNYCYNKYMEQNNPESLKNLLTKKQGGPRANAGRKKGSMNKATREMKEARKIFIDLVNKHVDKLFNAQLDLAIGEKHLMVVRTQGTGKNRKRWTELVTNPDIIRDYLDEELQDDDEHFYYMTTKPANNQAIDSMLNRSFGKAKESLDLTSGDEPLKGATIVFADKPETDSRDTDVP